MTAMMMIIKTTVMMMTIKTTMGNAALIVITTATGTDTAQITTETMTATALSVIGAPVLAIPAVGAAAARMMGMADVVKRTEKDSTGIMTTAHSVMVTRVMTVGAAKATVKTTGMVDVVKCGERRRRIVKVTVGVGVDAVVDTDVDIGRR